MTSTDVDKVYIERIKPRLIKDTPTELIRRWSVSAHSVMEVTGPSPFGEDGNVLLWLHEKSLTQLLDMCDAVDKRFSDVEQAATLGNGTCELIDRGKFMPSHEFHRVECSECGVLFWQSHGHLPAARFCPSCGKAVKR